MEEMLSSESGRQLAGSEELTPFPDSHRQHHHFMAVGPQKLRPIRSTLGFQKALLPVNCSATASSSSDSTPRKKRKKKKKKMECFLQELICQVIHKQEEMHQQLMELFVNNEKQRMLREEAWREEEMERTKRDHEIRAQEAARSLALISFIRNALGVPDIQVPEYPNNMRWPTSEVEALITLRASLDHKFHDLAAAKPPVWEEVSAGMASMGFIRSAKKCKEKWENLNKYYRKATATANTCPYFHHLEILYRNRLITCAKPNSPQHQMQTTS